MPYIYAVAVVTTFLQSRVAIALLNMRLLAIADEVGREDDFFLMGGDSRSATVLAHQVEERFKVDDFRVSPQ